MDILENDKPAAPPPRKREREERPERPKNSIKEDLDYRINGLEKAKEETGMSQGDISALNRAIAKLQEKKAEKAPKPEKQMDEEKF
jgi:hypothetical protein